MTLLDRYRQVRGQTEALVEGLSAEDMTPQSMPDASPAKWHLAHTAWFFETFVLDSACPGWTPVDPRYAVLFNSYYRGVGERFERPCRGLLTRPSVAEVMAYRRAVDEAMVNSWAQLTEEARDLVALGLHHEQQHQELLLTDIKHLFSINPLEPAWEQGPRPPLRTSERARLEHPGGLVETGHEGPGFCFDNEQPRHRQWLEPFELSAAHVTNGEFLQFMEDGGYTRPELWMDLGYTVASAESWRMPLYWRRESDGSWSEFTLAGRRPIEPDGPVTHVSWFEADAFARWAGARLPTEVEWEAIAGASMPKVEWFRNRDIHPRPGVGLYGEVWVWTASPYVPYPGYRPAAGAVGEYNGKFMSQQMVLRGGSCATPPGHIRGSYRNFFPPATRWQFSGIRLAW